MQMQIRPRSRPPIPEGVEVAFAVVAADVDRVWTGMMALGHEMALIKRAEEHWHEVYVFTDAAYAAMVDLAPRNPFVVPSSPSKR